MKILKIYIDNCDSYHCITMRRAPILCRQFPLYHILCAAFPHKLLDNFQTERSVLHKTSQHILNIRCHSIYKKLECKSNYLYLPSTSILHSSAPSTYLQTISFFTGELNLYSLCPQLLPLPTLYSFFVWLGFRKSGMADNVHDVTQTSQ